MSGLSFDFSELIKRAIKYIIEGIMVAIASYVIPKKQLNVEEGGKFEVSNAETLLAQLG